MASGRKPNQLKTRQAVRKHIEGLPRGERLNYHTLMNLAETEEAREAVLQRLQDPLTPHIDLMLRDGASETEIRAHIEGKFGRGHLPETPLTRFIRERRELLLEAKKMPKF